MQSQQERLMGELATDIAELADDLPSWMDDPPEADLQTFTALQDAAEALWALWREVQVEKDLAA
jgi:hypothetical protein